MGGDNCKRHVGLKQGNANEQYLTTPRHCSIFVSVYMQKQIVGWLDMKMQNQHFHWWSVEKRN